MAVTHGKTKRWDRTAYRALAEANILGAAERVELIEGEIITMSPQGPQHAATIRRLTQMLVEKFGSTHAVAPQCSLDLGEYSQPEPDFALIRHEDDPGAAALPQKADLIIEVSVSSLSYDRNEKCSLYAKAGVPEVWIVHPEGGWIEVYREPVPDAAAVFGFGYASKRTVRRSEFVSPSWAPDALIGVDGVV